MHDNSISRVERLKSRKLISKVFKEGKSIFKFPVRLVYLDISRETDQILPFQVAFTVPKKKIPKAVDRNLLKRRMREVYRLQRNQFLLALKKDDSTRLAIVFVYQFDEMATYQVIEKAFIKLLKRMVNREL